jgi:GABA permease
MPRYLVVANQTLGGDSLLEEIARRIAAGPASFYVLVPQTPPRRASLDDVAVGQSREPWSAPVEVRGEMAAHRALLTEQSRLERLTSEIRARGADVRGSLGDPDPLKAIGAVLAAGETFDGIIISTLPIGVSRWLRMDLPRKVERRYRLPVTTVTAKPAK